MIRTRPSNQLIVFVRAPRLGRVKTRLSAGLGNEGALAAYKLLVRTVLYQIASLSAVELRYTPADAINEITPWLRSGWQARPQCEGDLGARMHGAFVEAFAEGAQRVALIGSDSPELTVEDIQSAWSSLEDNDLVLGPAADGGYWLIGLRKPQASLFQGISWGMSTVLGQTLARAGAAGLRSRMLRVLSDVDTQKAWAEFIRRRSAPARPSEPG